MRSLPTLFSINIFVQEAATCFSEMVKRQPLVRLSEVIDWTARLTGAAKRGMIDATESPILHKLGFSERQWRTQMRGTETRLLRAIGNRWSRKLRPSDRAD